MTATILNAPPISGLYPEFSFGGKFNFPLWIEFKLPTDDIWYGCFPKLFENTFSTALIANNGQTAFIVAGGQGFLIDTDNKKLLVTTEECPAIVSAIKTNNPEYFIAGEFYGAYVINTTGELKTIEPHFSTDGIFFTGQKDNKAIGQLDSLMNQYEYKYDFEVDLETFEFSIIPSHHKSIKQNHKPSFWKRLFLQ